MTKHKAIILTFFLVLITGAILHSIKLLIFGGSLDLWSYVLGCLETAIALTALTILKP